MAFLKQMQSASRSRWTALLVFLSGMALTAISYWPGLYGPFLLDDVQNIQMVMDQRSGLSFQDAYRVIMTNDSGMFGRSVSMLSFYITALLHGLSPWAFKYHNLLIHLSGGVVVFLLVRELLFIGSDRLNETRQLWVATVTTLLWLLHPLQVSSVLYAVQRMAMLGGFFTLLALYAYVSGRRLLLLSRWKARAIILGVFPAIGLLAIFAKENGGLIPFFVVLLEATILNKLPRRKSIGVENHFYPLIYGLIPVLIVVFYIATHWASFTNYVSRSYSLSERLMTELHVVAMYCHQILLPRLSNMSLYHDFKITSSLDISTILLLAALLLAMAVVVCCRNKAPLLAFGMGWFLCSHLMESTFIPLELVFEHRNYIALLGLLLPAVYYLFVFADNKKLVVVASGFCVIFLGLLTAVRAKEWGNLDVMLGVAYLEQPNSLRGNVEYANIKINEGDFSAALEILEHAYEVAPLEYGTLIHSVILGCQIGIDTQPLFDELDHVVPINPVTYYSLSTTESLISIAGNDICSELDLDDAIPLVNMMLANPANEANPQMFSYILRVNGYLQFGLGNFADGFTSFMTAYNLHSSPMVLQELADNLITFNYLSDAQLVIEKYREVSESQYNIYSDNITQLEQRLGERHEELILQLDNNAEDGNQMEKLGE